MRSCVGDKGLNSPAVVSGMHACVYRYLSGAEMGTSLYFSATASSLPLRFILTAVLVSALSCANIACAHTHCAGLCC